MSRRAYFQYYETFENVVNKIKNVEEREHMRAVIINYGLYGTEPEELTELEEMAWTICKELIDQQQHRREVNAENRRKAPAAPALHDPEPEPAAEKTKKFTKPTVDEIAAYCDEKKLNVNAQQFFNYYEANGWKCGRVAMKNWQAALQNWNTRERKNGKGAGTIWTGAAENDTAAYEDMF